jgi:Peptidase M10 serralysin C terminal
MCFFCGHPGLVHDFGSGTPTFNSGTEGGTATFAGATVRNNGSSISATPPAGSEAEIAFLSGLTSSNQLAATSFWTWNGNRPATYSSVSDAAKWGSPTPGTPGGNVTYWFDAASAWNATETSALVSSLDLWSAEANITFSLASSAASANFIFYRGHNGSAYESSNSTSTTVGSGSTGSYLSTGTLISIDTSVAGFGPIGASFSAYGGYPYQTLVHEIGHLVGLGHGGPYNGSVNPATQQFSAYDTRLWSLMSYINPWVTSAKYYGSYPVTGTNWGISPDGYYYEPTTPMILDILAAQWLYGPAASGPLASGGQVFGFHSNISGSIAPYFNFTVNTHPVITIWDGGLNNTLDLSGWSAPAAINLNPGTFSNANGAVNNIGIAVGTVIETAIGGGGYDTIIGNSYNNTLVGGAGNDTVNGAGGVDTVVYSSLRAQYQITQSPDGSIRIFDLRANAPDGVDSVSNVEFFQFADYTVSADHIFNHPPVVTVTSATVQENSTQPVQVSTLFSASDADGDTLAYLFYDGTIGGGHFAVNGTPQPEGSGQYFGVSAAQLSQVTFVPAQGSSDDLLFGATDGYLFSGWSAQHINGPVDHAPVVTVTSAMVQENSTQPIPVSTLFSASDADGDTLAYLFYDGTIGGGHFAVNGTPQPEGSGQYFGVSAAQLSQVTFVPAQGSSDDLLFGATDGLAFSGWSISTINGPAGQSPSGMVAGAANDALWHQFG